jgi:hypothetical protein
MHGTSEVSNFALAMEAVGNTAFIVLWMRGTAHKPLRWIGWKGRMEEEGKKYKSSQGEKRGRKISRILRCDTLHNR